MLCAGIALLTLVTSLVGVGVAGASSVKREQPGLLVQAGTSKVIYLVASTGCVGARVRSPLSHQRGRDDVHAGQRTAHRG